MMSDDSKRAGRKDFVLAAAMVASGLVICGLSLAELRAHNPQVAQATQPLQASPPPTQDSAPAESKPGGARPTTPAPEPARPPDTQAQKDGTKAALPPAPAEKIAPPIKDR